MIKRFLHITPISPAPSGNGLAMRTSMFLEALSCEGSVDVVVIGSSASRGKCWDREGIKLNLVLTDGRADTRLSLISQISSPTARAAALRACGRPLATAGLSAPVLADAARICGARDWSGILLSRAYMLPVLDVLPATARYVPIYVDLDDDDADLCREMALAATRDGNDSRAAVLEAEADAFDNLIRMYKDRVDMFTCASEVVARSLGSRLGLTIRTILNGVDTTRQVRKCRLSKTLIFVANLSYEPNIDGLLWFVERVFPLIREQEHDSNLLVAGSQPTRSVRDACAGRGIALYPDPDDLAPLYRSAGAAVVPLRFGSGSRIKILEAAMHGLPVITTCKGSEGLDDNLSKALFVGQAQPEEFAQICLTCLGDTQSALAQAATLQGLVCSRHDRSRIVSKIENLFAGG